MWKPATGAQRAQFRVIAVPGAMGRSPACVRALPTATTTRRSRRPARRRSPSRAVPPCLRPGCDRWGPEPRDRWLIITFVSGAILIAMGVLMLTGQITRLNVEAQNLLNSLGLDFLWNV